MKRGWMTNVRKNKKMSQVTSILGLGLLLIAWLLPLRIVEGLGPLRPLGFVCLYICPLLGLIGLVFSIRDRSILFALINLGLILSFPLLMIIVYSLP